MRPSIYNITLDVKSIQSQLSLPMRKDFTARNICISLVDGVKPYEINEGCVAVFAGKKADGTNFAHYCIVSNNKIVYEVQEQTVSCPGIVECEVILYGAGGTILVTPRLTMVVDDNITGNIPVSEDDLAVFNEIVLAEIQRVEAEAKRNEEFELMLVQGKNFLDESELVVGAITSDGRDNDTTTSFKRTPYIYLEAGSYIYSNSGNSYANFRVCIYDLNKTFESTQAGAGKNGFTLDAPKYIRIHDSSSRTEMQLEAGTEITEYEPYQKLLRTEYIPIDELDIVNVDTELSKESNNAIANSTVANKFGSYFGVGKNLYNHKKSTPGVACNNVANVGEISTTVVASTHSTSDWVEVVAGETYILSQGSTNTGYRMHFADDNNVLVKIELSLLPKRPITIPEGCTKIRFSTTTEKMGVTQLEKGDTVTDFEQYKELLKDECVPENLVKDCLNGKTIYFDGDSITYGTGFTDVTLAYPYLVCKKLGAKIINKAIGGSTLASNPSNETRNPLVLRYNTQISDEEAETVDAVYIAIGTNDWAYGYTPVGTMEDRVATTFYGALHLLCQGLLEKFAGKPIVFATPIKRRLKQSSTTPYDDLRADKTLKDYCNIIKEVCDFYSIPVLDMYSECCLTPFIDGHVDAYFQEDFAAGASTVVHPNAEGHKIMARRVTGYLRSIIG